MGRRRNTVNAEDTLNRDKRVVELVKLGLTRQAIGERLGLSASYVRAITYRMKRSAAQVRSEG
jgi:DNA-binding CsgD family transcriptional regulator